MVVRVMEVVTEKGEEKAFLITVKRGDQFDKIESTHTLEVRAENQTEALCAVLTHSSTKRFLSEK